MFDLIKAFAALPESDRNSAQLFMAGNGDVESVRQLIQDLNTSSNATISNWINPSERDELLASANAFVLPSYNECLLMSILEAMAWSLPVIVTPVCGIPEVIKDNENGRLISPGNIEQLSAALQRIIRDEHLKISLGNATRQNA